MYPGRDDLHLFFPAQFSREKDTLQVHLATSRDGVRLEYFGDRPVIPIEADGAGDEKRVYAGVGIVPLGTDTVAVPCSRWHHTHNEDTAEGFRKAYQGEYFWATWSVDRFAAVEADERGFFATPVFDDPLAGISVNATTYPSGEIRVQLTDETGVPIEGYAFAQCDAVRGDEIRRPGNLARPPRDRGAFRETPGDPDPDDAGEALRIVHGMTCGRRADER